MNRQQFKIGDKVHSDIISLNKKLNKFRYLNIGKIVKILNLGDSLQLYINFSDKGKNRIFCTKVLEKDFDKLLKI